MKNSSTSSNKESFISKYFNQGKIARIEGKSTDINILLNRVRLDKKRESRKKIVFSAVTTLGVLLFGVLVF